MSSQSAIIDTTGGPAYRNSEVQVCHICQIREVVATCARCGAPLCVQHLPVGREQRCFDCELQFHRKRRRLDDKREKLVGWGSLLAGAAGVATVAVGVLTGHGAVALVSLAVTLPLIADAVFRKVQRRRFLRQHSEAEHPVTLGDRRVRIAPRSQADAEVRRLTPPGGPRNPPRR